MERLSAQAIKDSKKYSKEKTIEQLIDTTKEFGLLTE